MRVKPQDVAQPVPGIAQTAYIHATGDTSGLGGSYQLYPGMSQAFFCRKGQVVLMMGSAGLWGGGNDSRVFWRAQGPAGYQADQGGGANASAGHQNVPVNWRFVIPADGTWTFQLYCYTISGGGGQGIGATTDAIIQILNP